jgi:hypothetical protein
MKTIAMLSAVLFCLTAFAATSKVEAGSGQTCTSTCSGPPGQRTCTRSCY